ncbi:MAG: deoxyribonuclease IV [Lachnospiraceae bacterium]|nr:deoxyribonuclease IV [Lachnospiraceae bacterium]
MLTIGTHMSIAGGIAQTAENVVKMGADTMQIFSRNPRGSGYRIYEEAEIEKFQRIRRENGFGPLLAHAPYTLNLASGTERTYEFACMVIREDIARMDQLEMENLVFHPGSHTGIGKEAGIQNIIAGLNQAITGQEKLTVLLETMSGKGTEIGDRFEDLKAIRDGAEHPERIGICLDTCHVFAAGYDIVNDLEGVLEEFDRVLGLSLLRAVHLNDSMMPFGSHKDRHAVIGGGMIGMEALLRVLEHPVLSKLPFYLETPLDDQGHKEEIDRIRELLRQRREEGTEG